MKQKIKVAISVGDINGIGPEIILKTFSNKAILDFFTPVIFGSVKLFSYYIKELNLNNINLNGIKSPKQAIHGKINVVNLWKDAPNIEVGKSTNIGGQLSFESLKSATESVKNGECDVLVTAPINKENIQSEEFRFPGHTEFLAEKWNGKSLMFMVCENLRVGLLTQHIPIKNVAESTTPELIEQKVNEIQKSLIEDFGITKPKIAILGLNPHAGDGDLLGTEDKNIIAPTVKKLFDKGTYCFGPYSADSFFMPETLKNYDAVLAMYHDQGLIPFKTLSFGNGVNFTAGLDFVRTSPDHGVAYDIAGQGIADESSFKTAIYTAIEILKNRKEYAELTENPLEKYDEKKLNSREEKYGAHKKAPVEKS